MDKRYAIFDMDGTIIDSMGFWRGLTGEVLEKHGISKECITQELSDTIKPMTATESAKYFIDRFGIKASPEAIVEQINNTMADHYKNDIPLKSGIKEYLDKLKASGVKMCVASATTPSLVDKCLTRLGVREYFDFLISCEEVGAGKNKPDIYIEAARRLGSEPNETAVYEDAIFAMETAKKSGFYLIGVYDKYSKDNWPEIISIADELIESWESQKHE